MALYSGSIQIWDYQRQRVVLQVLLEDDCFSPARCVDFHPSLAVLAFGGDSGEIHTVTYCTARSVCPSSNKIWTRKWNAHQDFIRAVQFHPNPSRNLLLSGGEDQVVYVWDWQSAYLLWSTPQPFFEHYVTSARWSDDAELEFVVGSRDKSVSIWRIPQEERKKRVCDLVWLRLTGTAVEAAEVRYCVILPTGEDNCLQANTQRHEDVTPTCALDVSGDRPIPGSVAPFRYVRRNYFAACSLQGNIALLKQVDEGFSCAAKASVGVRSWCLAANSKLLAAATDEGITLFALPDLGGRCWLGPFETIPGGDVLPLCDPQQGNSISIPQCLGEGSTLRSINSDVLQDILDFAAEDESTLLAIVHVCRGFREAGSQLAAWEALVPLNRWQASAEKRLSLLKTDGCMAKIRVEEQTSAQFAHSWKRKGGCLRCDSIVDDGKMPLPWLPNDGGGCEGGRERAQPASHVCKVNFGQHIFDTPTPVLHYNQVVCRSLYQWRELRMLREGFTPH